METWSGEQRVSEIYRFWVPNCNLPCDSMSNPQLAQEQLQEDLLTLLEELDDDIKVVICKLVCETFDKLSPESISEEVR